MIVRYSLLVVLLFLASWSNGSCFLPESKNAVTKRVAPAALTVGVVPMAAAVRNLRNMFALPSWLSSSPSKSLDRQEPPRAFSLSQLELSQGLIELLKIGAFVFVGWKVRNKK